MGTIEKHAFEDPIVIVFGDEQGVVLRDKRNEGETKIVPAVTFDDVHYGFNLIIDKNGHISQKAYKTLCPIYGVELQDNGQLIIYEYGRRFPWRFSKSGNLISEALYCPTLYTDLNHALENFNADQRSNPEIFKDMGQFKTGNSRRKSSRRKK